MSAATYAAGTASSAAHAVGVPGPELNPERVGVMTISGNLTLTNAYRNVLKIDGGASHRDVTLPTAEAGMHFRIINANSGAYNLVVKNAAGSTIGTANQNEQIEVFVSDEATPTWTLLCVSSIALS